jgi:hypothetical protein
VQETSLVQFGTYSVKWANSQVSVENGFVMQAAPPYHKGQPFVRAKVNVYTSVSASVTLVLCDATGAELTGMGFAATRVSSTASGWRTITLTAGSPSSALAAQGPCIRVVVQHGSAVDTVLDAAMLTIDEALPANFCIGSGRAAAWVAANNYLVAVAPGTRRYVFGIADLHTILPADYPDDAITVGGMARIRDVDLGVSTTQRIMELTDDHIDPARSLVTLARYTPTLTARLVEANF